MMSSSDLHGACFVCSGLDEPEKNSEGNLTRRQLLVQGGLAGVAFGAASVHAPSLLSSLD